MSITYFSTFPLQYFSLSLNLFYLALEDGSPLFQQVYSHCTYYLLLATASSCSQQKQLQDFFYLLWQVTDDFTRATSILAGVCLADVRQADVCLASIANIGFSDFTHRYFQSLGWFPFLSLLKWFTSGSLFKRFSLGTPLMFLALGFIPPFL